MVHYSEENSRFIPYMVKHAMIPRKENLSYKSYVQIYALNLITDNSQRKHKH